MPVDTDRPSGAPTRARGQLTALLLIAGVTVAFEAAALWQGPPTVEVSAGPFLMGSTRAERDAAYALDEAAYGHARTRQARWYENEPLLHEEMTAAFAIMTVPVTDADYARFVAETGHQPPFVDGATWRDYGVVHPYSAVQRFLWDGSKPRPGREMHPVVLVSHDDTEVYAAWLSRVTGRHWRLPTDVEWEKAARGTDGRRFPWGDAFDPTHLASHDAGPFDTVPVGSHSTGASPFGMLDAAGLVFEWTATPEGPNRYIVKGGSWDDKGCGVCRPAARHARPADIRHILIGFDWCAIPSALPRNLRLAARRVVVLGDVIDGRQPVGEVRAGERHALCTAAAQSVPSGRTRNRPGSENSARSGT